MGRRHQNQKQPAKGSLESLAHLRAQSLSQLLPGSVSSVQDTSLQTLPRILGAEVAYRSRLVEELHLMQTVLTRELFREMKDRPAASLPALVREIRACITDQLRIVEKAPIGTGTEAARSQVRDLLQRHALVAAELRRKGLGQLLDRLHQAEGDLPAQLAGFAAGGAPADAGAARERAGEGEGGQAGVS